MEENNPSSRKNFLLWGTALLSALAVLRIIKCTKKKKTANPVTVKMLGQDGKLVEVDISEIACRKSKKITDDQLKNWVTYK